ncbi:hypothetical protein [Nocardiopsis sp. CNT312]|uniref:hypothetical protein n=1 Tax=Nocardiopsis sp. CNT312 TaxID=1137268 RepID=UPI000491212A|nr:hypothetical protein [Nocardiopsis sp. CNT312]
MSDTRSHPAALRSLVLLSAAALLAPAAPALAEAEWITQNLASADRVGLVLSSGALRLDEDTAEEVTAARSGDGGTVGGLAVFPEQRLDAAADRLEVSVRAEGDLRDLLVEARGLRGDGMWTEWHPASHGDRVALPEPVSWVQLRVEVEKEDAALAGLRVRPLEGPGERRGTGYDGYGTEGEPGRETDAPFSARLFATRIGLVGATTANGHTVRADDHFVALPSRRALASRDTGEYTVRVCTTGALGPHPPVGEVEGHERRCAYLPVWDVGPWNTTDDHWNASRSSWPDLARGRPQAQAAYHDGHNGGLDGFGRRVRNPAGIDLADGAFREGLELPTNGWVDVDYLWTAEYGSRARITTVSRKDPVIVRGGPGREHDAVGLAAHSAVVDVRCRTGGDEVSGPFGTGGVWYRIGEGDYVPAVFADGGADARECSPEP